jgi:MraZ protein
MFRGNHQSRVDEKGRLKLPAEFKRLLDEKYGPFTEEAPAKFFITSKDGLEAEIYPMKEWERIEEGLAKIPSMNQAKIKFMKIVNYYGGMAEMDGQGRVLIPQTLREAAKTIGDVVVYGMQNYLQVANHEDFKARMEAAPLTEADGEALAALGL